MDETALLAINLGIFGLLWLIGTGKITYTTRKLQWVKTSIDRILHWMDHSIVGALVGSLVIGLPLNILFVIAIMVAGLIPVTIAKIIWEIGCYIAEW